MIATQEKLKAFVGTGQLGPFTNGYWGHPAMKLSPEINLVAVAHYLQALDVQRAGQQDRHHPGLQDPAHSEPGGGRRLEPDRGR